MSRPIIIFVLFFGDVNLAPPPKSGARGSCLPLPPLATPLCLCINCNQLIDTPNNMPLITVQMFAQERRMVWQRRFCDEGSRKVQPKVLVMLCTHHYLLR